MKLKVTHVEGSKKGTVETFDLPVVTVGRDPSNALVFDPVKDDRVSTKHAAFSEQGGAVIVTDMGSRNGTLVNGQKISGPTPVTSGGLVQFGENGPMVLLTFETAAAAPAPAPAPAKKGGGGGCVVVLLLLVLLLGAAGVGAFLFLRGRHAGDPWAKYGPGSTFELLTETKIERPVSMEMKVSMKQTVVSVTEESVKLKIDSTVGDRTTTLESSIDRKPKESANAEKPLEEKRESVTVPAGTYDCKYTKRKSGDTTIETWTADSIPVPVKTVNTSETQRSTMTLVKVEAK